jgi:hypothetical protein
MRGWSILLAASIAGVALYFYEKKTLVKGVTASTALQTVVSAQGSCVTNSDGTASCMADPDADVDAGVPASPQAQTEAAYNANIGSGDQLTTGNNTQQDDYDSYDDSSEVAQ